MIPANEALFITLWPPGLSRLPSRGVAPIPCERLSRLQRRILAWLAAEAQRTRGTMSASHQDLTRALAHDMGNVSIRLKGLEVKGWVTITRTPGIITTRLSQRVYRTRMIEMQRELFAGHAFILSHEGRDREQVDRGENVPAESRQRRLAEVAPNLDQIGKLLDVPRGERETDEQFVERLKPHFSSQPLDRRWARWTRAIRWLTRRGL